MELITLDLHGLEADLKESWVGSQALVNMGIFSIPVMFLVG